MDCLGTYFTHAQTECNSCSKCFGMDCFGTCFTHAQTSDVKLPCKHPRSPLQRWRLQAPFKPPFSTLQRWRLQAPLKPPLSPLEGQAPFKPPLSPLEAPFKPPRSPLHLQKASSPLQAPLKPPASPLEAFRRWSPLQAPFKPPSSPFQVPRSPLQRWRLQAPFKPPWSPFEAPFKRLWSLPKVKPPSSPLEAALKLPWSPLEASLKPSEGEAPFDLQTFVPPPLAPDPSSPLEGASEGGTSEPAPPGRTVRLVPSLSLPSSAIFSSSFPLSFPSLLFLFFCLLCYIVLAQHGYTQSGNTLRPTSGR